MCTDQTTYCGERVAQAIHDAQQQPCSWSDETEGDRNRFRQYAHNAMMLLDEDIGVLLAALAEAAEEQRAR
jgi:hypothetical protein